MSKSGGGFLSNFSGTNTPKPLNPTNEQSIEKKETKERTTNPTNTSSKSKEDKNSKVPTDTTIEKNKQNAKEKISSDVKKTTVNTTQNNVTSEGITKRPAQSSSAIIKAPEHTIKKDDEFHKRKMVRYGVIGVSTIVVSVLIFFIFRMFNSVEVLNFQGEEFSRAEIFGLTNDISIERANEYSLEYPDGVIIDQDREPGSNMMKGSVLRVTVSRGPDMNELVILPDFEDMTAQQIRTWINQNQMRNITVRTEASEEVAEHNVIRVNVPNDVDVNHFNRSHSLTIYVSTGPEVVEIGNFRGQTREQVETWMRNNPLAQVEFVYEASETVAAGSVLGQSHVPNSNLPSDQTLTITLSGGPSVIVPNFHEGLFGEIKEMLPEGLRLIERTRLSATVGFGRVIYQDVQAGTEVFGDDATVTVFVSAGRPWIRNLVGIAEGDLSQFFFENFIRLGANISFTVTYVDSYLPRGQVVSHSHDGIFLGMTDTVNVRVSRGNITPPAGMPEASPTPPPSSPSTPDAPEGDE